MKILPFELKSAGTLIPTSFDYWSLINNYSSAQVRSNIMNTIFIPVENNIFFNVTDVIKPTVVETLSN